MFTSLPITSQLAGYRQHDMLARAQHLSVVRRLRAQARTAQHAEQPGRRLRRTLRAATRPRPEPQT